MIDAQQLCRDICDTNCMVQSSWPLRNFKYSCPFSHLPEKVGYQVYTSHFLTSGPSSLLSLFSVDLSTGSPRRISFCKTVKMSGILRRLRGRGTEEVEGATPSPHDSIDGSGDHSEKIEKVTGASMARDAGEVEANRKLSVFEKAHRWDPNLDDDQLLEIDDAVNARDPNAEGRIYDEVFENSPYPEVRFPSCQAFCQVLEQLLTLS